MRKYKIRSVLYFAYAFFLLPVPNDAKDPLWL
jgi:hypothetical protein